MKKRLSRWVFKSEKLRGYPDSTCLNAKKNRKRGKRFLRGFLQKQTRPYSNTHNQKMSDNIPFDIQREIIQRIPDTKWLIRCRSVSKAWKSVIDSKDFVTAHTLRHQAHNHRLLLRIKDDDIRQQVKYLSVVDDDSFPQQKVSVFVPDSVKNICNDSNIIGTSHGLFCLLVSKTDTAVIWNPSIRKTVAVKIPKVCGRYYRTEFGFGVCRGILDPKIVRITFVTSPSRLQDGNTSTQVEVFTLGSGGTWRSSLSSNVPHKSIEFGYSQVVIDGVIYWKAVDRLNVDNGFRNHNLIMSFDLTSEEFNKVNLPDPLAPKNPYARLLLYNLRESLAVLEYNMHTGRRSWNVWMMMIGNGCTRSFNKLYSIVANTPDASIVTTLGFRWSGTPIIEVENDDEDDGYSPVELAIYEPESKSKTSIGIYGFPGTFFVRSYMETLLLLGH